MADGTLYIGNRRYSSWSMRGWLAVRLAGLDVDEVRVGRRQRDAVDDGERHREGMAPCITAGARARRAPTAPSGRRIRRR